MDEQKGKASTKAKNKYNSLNYDSLRITVPKGQKEILQAHAVTMKESLNAFVARAVKEAMERDKIKIAETLD